MSNRRSHELRICKPNFIARGTSSGRVKSGHRPMGGILRTGRFVGEYADQVTPVAELCVEGSTELVVYLPQSVARDYPIGKTVTTPCQSNRRQTSLARCSESQWRCSEHQSRYRGTIARRNRCFRSTFESKDARNAPRWLALGSEVRLPRSEQLSWPLNLKEMVEFR